MIALLRLGRCDLLEALAGARLSNFASNMGALLVYALGGHIFVAAGLAMGVGNFVGAQLGARTALRAGAKVIRPLVVVVACALAARLLLQPDAPWGEWLRWSPLTGEALRIRDPLGFASWDASLEGFSVRPARCEFIRRP